MFCAFIDYRKAFYSVDRICLWNKLLAGGITGKLFNVIFNMYKQAKSYVQFHKSQSEFFSCLAGVRQGENLSPILFAICRFRSLLEKNKYKGLPFLKEKIVQNGQIDLFLNLFVLLYADDTIIMAETKDELQLAIDGMK